MMAMNWKDVRSTLAVHVALGCLLISSAALAEGPYEPPGVQGENATALLEKADQLFTQINSSTHEFFSQYADDTNFTSAFKTFLQADNRCAAIGQFVEDAQAEFRLTSHLSSRSSIRTLRESILTQIASLETALTSGELILADEARAQRIGTSYRVLLTKLDLIDEDLLTLAHGDPDSEDFLSELRETAQEFCQRIGPDWGGLGTVEKQLDFTKYLLKLADIEFITAEEIKKKFEGGLWSASIRPIFMKKVLKHLNEMEAHLYRAKLMLRPFSYMLNTNPPLAYLIMGEKNLKMYERQLGVINTYFTGAEYDTDAEIASWQITAQALEETLKASLRAGMALLLPGALGSIKIPQYMSIAAGVTLTSAYFSAQVQEAGGLREFFIQMKDDAGIVQDSCSACMDGEEFATLQFFESLTRFYYNAKALSNVTSVFTKGLLFSKKLDVDVSDLLVD